MMQGQDGLHGVAQGAVPDDSMEWDWDAIERRGRIAERIGGYAFIATVASLAGILAILIVGGIRPVSMVVAGFGAVSCAVMVLASLAGRCRFVLDPRSYWAWLRTLGPYEPETVWEQARNQLAAWIGGTWLLVIGALLGALFGTDPSQASMISTQYVGQLLLVGVPFLWWAAFLVRLASLHRRAMKRNELPGEFDRLGLFFMFFIYWAVGAGLVLGLVLGGPELLRALDAAGSPS